MLSIGWIAFFIPLSEATMITRLTVSLSTEEGVALSEMAHVDFRPPKDELRWLVRAEAERRGLFHRAGAAHDTEPAVVDAEHSGK